MLITKINLQTNGLKGAHVTHFSQVTKNNRTKPKETIEKEQHPIHLALETPFKDLRWHLLDLCDIIHEDMTKAEIDYLRDDTFVSGIRLDHKSKSFVIVGSKRTAKTGKIFNFETPETLPADCYGHYDTVMAIIEKIVEETKLYLSGEVKVTDEELTQRWVESGKVKHVDMATWENLPKEEKERIAQDILSKAGAVVFMPADISVESAADEVVKEQLEQSADEDSEQEIVFDSNQTEVHIPATPVTLKK